MAFSPSTLTVRAGTTVTVTNRDAVAHTFTSDTNGWDSGLIQPGHSYRHTFTQAGRYRYHCSVHPSMAGTVIVTS
jgi:plastocyanin